MCSELNLHYKMTPSYVSSQIVIDSGGNSNAIRGEDSLSTSQDP